MLSFLTCFVFQPALDRLFNQMSSSLSCFTFGPETFCHGATPGNIRPNRHLSRVRILSVPAKSKKQQMAAGVALAAKRGERSKASLKGASRQMVESMGEEQLEDFAKTKRKHLPTKKTSRDPDPSSKSGRDRKTSSGKSKDR
jgi:hypothetical protein